MANSTLTLFRQLVPALCEETNARINVFITVAAQRLDASKWGAVYQTALVYLTAHLLLRSPVDNGTEEMSASGPVTSRKTGDEAITYGSLGVSSIVMTDADLAQTHPGQCFLGLRNTRAAGLPFFAC